MAVRAITESAWIWDQPDRLAKPRCTCFLANPTPPPPTGQVLPCFGGSNHKQLRQNHTHQNSSTIGIFCARSLAECNSRLDSDGFALIVAKLSPEQRYPDGINRRKYRGSANWLREFHAACGAKHALALLTYRSVEACVGRHTYVYVWILPKRTFHIRGIQKVWQKTWYSYLACALVPSIG